MVTRGGETTLPAQQDHHPDRTRRLQKCRSVPERERGRICIFGARYGRAGGRGTEFSRERWAGTSGQRQREKGAPARENPDRCKESGFRPETPENRRAGHGREGRRTGRELIPKTGEDTLRDPAADCPKNRRNPKNMSELSLPRIPRDRPGVYCRVAQRFRFRRGG